MSAAYDARMQPKRRARGLAALFSMSPKPLSPGIICAMRSAETTTSHSDESERCVLSCPSQVIVVLLSLSV